MSEVSKTFIVHVVINGSEQQVPIIAASLDEAAEWAEARYEDAGHTVNRIRPKV